MLSLTNSLSKSDKKTDIIFGPIPPKDKQDSDKIYIHTRPAPKDQKSPSGITIIHKGNIYKPKNHNSSSETDAIGKRCADLVTDTISHWQDTF